MTQDERRALLRRRFKAIGGLPYIKHEPRPSKPERVVPTKSTAGKPLRVFFGVSLCEARSAWIGQTDPDQPAGLVPKRRKGESPLTRIADQYPRRLPRH